MWVATQDLSRSAADPFYARLNQILDQAEFDGYVEALCQRFYADEIGRPGLPPGRYFRLLLIGYFEGLDAERAIAWRAADSFALREFLGLVLPEAPPDHWTISRTLRLIDLETLEAVFTWILQRLADAGLVKGKTIGIDATTLEANAALPSIVRRDTGATYQEFLTQLAQASGIDTPTREDLPRIDRKRPKKGSNDDWTHPLDPDAKITKMKDGWTHLAHKAEHAVDLETSAVVAVTVRDADAGDTATSIETLIEAAEQVETVVAEGEGIQEVVGDKGYHSNQVMVDLEGVGLRSYISEPDRGRRNWKDNLEARDAVYRNRRRIRGARGKRLLRQRGERLERPCAHLYETGRMRRVHLRGRDNIRKRLLVHAGGLNLACDAHALWRRHATKSPGPCGGAPRDVMVAHATS
jgi:transposase